MPLFNQTTGQTGYNAYIALFMTSLFYGANTVAGRLISGSLPTLTLSAFRILLALCLIIPIAWPALKKASKPNLKDLGSLFLFSVLGITIPYNFFVLALGHTTGTNVSLIIATFPAVTNLLIYLIYRNKPTPYQMIGIIASFIGLAVIFTQGDLSDLLSLQLGVGEMYIFCNVIALSLSTLLGKKIMRKFPSRVTSAYANLFGALTIVPLGLWQSGSTHWSLDWSGWLIVLYMGLGASGIAFFLNLYGVDKLGSSRAAIFGNLTPVCGIAFSMLILKETLAPYHIFGFLLVLAGIALSMKKAPAHQTPPLPKELSQQSI